MNNSKTHNYTSKQSYQNEDYEFNNYNNFNTDEIKTPFNEELNNKRYKKQVEEVQSRNTDNNDFEAKY